MLWIALIVLWLAGTYCLARLFSASCECDPDESHVLVFLVVSCWPIVAPIVLAQDLVDWVRDARL